MPVIFSDFLVSNEMSGYTENNSTTIFIVHELFLSYKLFKVYRNNMDHPVNYKGASQESKVNKKLGKNIYFWWKIAKKLPIYFC